MVINSLSTPHLFIFLDPKSSPMLPLHAYLSFSGFLGWFSLISTSQECYQLPFKTFQQFSFFKQLLTFCVFLFFILGQYILSQVSQKSSLTPLFSQSIIRFSIQDPFNLASLLIECFHSEHTYEHCYAHFLYYHVEIECNTSLISFHDIVLLGFFFFFQNRDRELLTSFHGVAYSYLVRIFYANIHYVVSLVQCFKFPCMVRFSLSPLSLFALLLGYPSLGSLFCIFLPRLRASPYLRSLPFHSLCMVWLIISPYIFLWLGLLSQFESWPCIFLIHSIIPYIRPILGIQLLSLFMPF